MVSTGVKVAATPRGASERGATTRRPRAGATTPKSPVGARTPGSGGDEAAAPSRWDNDTKRVGDALGEARRDSPRPSPNARASLRLRNSPFTRPESSTASPAARAGASPARAGASPAGGRTAQVEADVRELREKDRERDGDVQRMLEMVATLQAEMQSLRSEQAAAPKDASADAAEEVKGPPPEQPGAPSPGKGKSWRLF